MVARIWKHDIRQSPFLAAVFTVIVGSALYLLADAMGVFTPGPVIRGLGFVGIVSDGQSITFRTEGVKTTNDTIRGQTAAWVFSDGTATPAATPWAGEEIEAPVVPIRVAGEYFLSRTYQVTIPAAVFTDRGASFRMCYAYDPGLSCVEVRYADIPLQ